MEKKSADFAIQQAEFFHLLKKTYEKGISDQEITVEKLIEELKTDIQKVIAR